MISCGAFIMLTDKAFLAIHIGGDASNIREYSASAEINQFFDDHDGAFSIAAAMGPSGCSEVAQDMFSEALDKLFGSNLKIDVYLNQAKLAVSQSRLVGVPSEEICKPARRMHGTSACFEGRDRRNDGPAAAAYVRDAAQACGRAIARYPYCLAETACR